MQSRVISALIARAGSALVIVWLRLSIYFRIFVSLGQFCLNVPPNSMNSLYIIDCIAAYKAIYTYILIYKSI